MNEWGVKRGGRSLRAGISHMMGSGTNVVIACLVPLPSIFFYLSFLHSSSTTQHPHPIFTWCSHHPLLLANLLFLLNVDLLFWLIALLQSNHWLIDLYWTVVPVLLAHYYAAHPLARFDVSRSKVVIFLTWVWSVRLTHNYFRREGWQWGAREDWRFTDMRKQYGKHWWWISFFIVYASQQVFLIGICLPVYAIHTSEKPWNIWDIIGVMVCASGIVIAYIADTQLFNFVQQNNRVKDLGASPIPNLDSGLWRFSRHPNYLGEQLWWWGLVIFGWNVEQGWTFVGSLINSICLAYVTVLVERRMLRQAHRAESYRLYQETTSVWIPWFKSSVKQSENKSS